MTQIWPDSRDSFIRILFLTDLNVKDDEKEEEDNHV